MRAMQLPKYLLGGVFALMSVFNSSAWAISLEALLADMRDSHRTRASQYEEQKIHGELRLRQENTGWRLFGGTDFGHYRELEQTGTQSYDGFGAQLGLRYPLLGTLRAHRAAVIEADVSLAQSHHSTSLVRAEQRQLLRQAYIDWWQEQAISEWCAAYSPLGASEQAKVRTRTEQQHLRLSEQLWVEQRWRTLLRPCTDLTINSLRPRQHLDYLYGSLIPAAAKPMTESLPSLLAPLEQWRPVLERHPVMQLHLAEEQGLQPLLENRWTDRVDASLSISQRYDNRSDIHGNGGGTVAAITFEIPLISLTDSHRATPAKARYLAARERAVDANRSLTLTLEQTLQQYQIRVANLDERKRRLHHTRQLIKEQTARDSIDTEAGFMTLRFAILDNAALEREMIDDWHAAWSVFAQLRTLAEEQMPAHPGRLLRWIDLHETRRSEPLRPSGRPSARQWSTAVYVWDSSLLLDPARRDQQIRALSEAGFNRVYLGFNSSQIAELRRLRPHITELIGQLKAQGFMIDLLLGDPHWLLPAHRGDMLQLIESFAGLSFDHLHLDLEVEQLGWPVTQSRMKYWVQTLEAATKHSPWPVTIVSHHRWFAPTERVAETCLPCVLPQLDIRGATLMLYSTAIPSVVERTLQMMEAWPDLQLHLAQSIEPDLPQENSWAGANASALQTLNNRFKDELEPDGLAGIAWQDWSNYPRSTAVEAPHP